MSTVQVGPNGSILHAWQTAQPGTVIQLLPGTYVSVTLPPSTRPVGSAPVTIQGQPGVTLQALQISGASDLVVADTHLEYLGGQAFRAAGGAFVRPQNVTLRNLDVAPPAPLTNGGDPQFTSLVNWTIDSCSFHDWLDSFAGGVDHHIECFQLGGCQGLHVVNSSFLNGQTHAFFARAWSSSAYVPAQTIQGLVIDHCVLGKTKGGYNAVDIMDDLADPTLGATSATITSSAVGQSPSLRLSHGKATFRGNRSADPTAYALSLWKGAGYDVGDNVWQAISGHGGSPFPGDTIDPAVDLTVAP